MSTEQMIARRVRKGYNEADSRKLLTELVCTVSSQNLPHALHYQGFITAAQAENMAVPA